MNTLSTTHGLDVKIEGGSASDQRFVGAIVNSTLARAGFKNSRHVLSSASSIDGLAQSIIMPSMLDVIRQHNPAFMNTPMIISAYEPKPVTRERRSVDRVRERALMTATSFDDSDVVENSLNARWNTLSIEEKEEALLHV